MSILSKIIIIIVSCNFSKKVSHTWKKCGIPNSASVFHKYRMSFIFITAIQLQQVSTRRQVAYIYIHRAACHAAIQQWPARYVHYCVSNYCTTSCTITYRKHIGSWVRLYLPAILLVFIYRRWSLPELRVPSFLCLPTRPSRCLSIAKPACAKAKDSAAIEALKLKFHSLYCFTSFLLTNLHTSRVLPPPSRCLSQQSLPADRHGPVRKRRTRRQQQHPSQNTPNSPPLKPSTHQSPNSLSPSRCLPKQSPRAGGLIKNTDIKLVLFLQNQYFF